MSLLICALMYLNNQSHVYTRYPLIWGTIDFSKLHAINSRFAQWVVSRQFRKSCSKHEVLLILPRVLSPLFFTPSLFGVNVKSGRYARALRTYVRKVHQLKIIGDDCMQPLLFVTCGVAYVLLALPGGYSGGPGCCITVLTFVYSRTYYTDRAIQTNVSTVTK